jgi:signal transduction histidine kinase
MSARWAVVLMALGAAFAALVSALVYGAGHALAAAAFFAVCGAPVLVLSHLLARNRRRVGSLSRQFAAGVALVFGLVLAGVGGVALLMFVSLHDAYLLGVLLGFACALAVYCSWLLTQGIRRDIETVRDVLVAVGDGERAPVPIETEGNDEIGELARAADRMIERLAEHETRREASDRARRDLIAAVSHDLRTPLTSLQLLAQGMDDGLLDLDNGGRRYLNEMSVHVRSLSAMVDDLFELTRLEAGDIQWSMRRVRLDELVGETIEAMRAQAASKGVAVEARVPRDLAFARANPEKVQRVLFNLIQNAIRHTPADGSVTVAAEPSGDAIEVEVADTGNGIPPGQRERVFEPFFRGDARTGGGSGLGLTICRAIIEVHGGRIWLSECATGTRVRFTLPRARGEPDPAESRPESLAAGALRR